MGNDRKVVHLANSGKPDKLAAAVAELRGLLPGQIEYQRIMAKLQREAYQAYITEGFSPEQALELCKSVRP